jgi:hypothetical protein
MMNCGDILTFVVQKITLDMSNADYGKKGTTFGKIVLTIILFIIMLIWIYQKNGHFVPEQ